MYATSGSLWKTPATVGAVCVCVAETSMFFAGMPGLLLGERLRGVDQLTRDHAAIDDDDREFGLAVVEDEAPRVKRVVGRSRLLVGEVAVSPKSGTSQA